jgi:hypothetical protein
VAAQTKYDAVVSVQLAKWCARCGLTDKQIAGELGVVESTLHAWKKRHPEFAAALKQSKNFVDSLVEDSLLKSALGYEVVEEEFERDPLEQRVRWKKKRKQVAPNVIAQIFWLKNRRPDLWRDKPTPEDEEATDGLGELMSALRASAAKRSDGDGRPVDADS